MEGTCSESGHRAIWAGLDRDGPRTLTLSARFDAFDRPSDLADRLPKTLIHRNVPGERIHTFLSDFDRAWARTAPYGAHGRRQRWLAAVDLLANAWPIHRNPPLGGTARWRSRTTLPWGSRGAPLKALKDFGEGRVSDRVEQDEPHFVHAVETSRTVRSAMRAASSSGQP